MSDAKFFARIVIAKNIGMKVAEGRGFEPRRPVARSSGLANRRDKPLCHPSIGFDVVSFIGFGGHGRSRTPDPALRTRVLCPLSYVTEWRSREESNPRRPGVENRRSVR